MTPIDQLGVTIVSTLVGLIALTPIRRDWLRLVVYLGYAAAANAAFIVLVRML